MLLWCKLLNVRGLELERIHGVYRRFVWGEIEGDGVLVGGSAQHVDIQHHRLASLCSGADPIVHQCSTLGYLEHVTSLFKGRGFRRFGQSAKRFTQGNTGFSAVILEHILQCVSRFDCR